MKTRGSDKTPLLQRMEVAYLQDLSIYWSNLLRVNNLMVILNISMFFLTGLVAQGYYFTFISIGLLTLVAITTLLPIPAFRKLGYYLFCLSIELLALYFLVSSAVYWVQMGGKL
ncbi:MAG: hypothetical protein V7739_02365 [Motiliproteus sp.]